MGRGDAEVALLHDAARHARFERVSTLAASIFERAAAEIISHTDGVLDAETLDHAETSAWRAAQHFALRREERERALNDEIARKP